MFLQAATSLQRFHPRDLGVADRAQRLVDRRIDIALDEHVDGRRRGHPDGDRGTNQRRVRCYEIAQLVTGPDTHEAIQLAALTSAGHLGKLLTQRFPDDPVEVGVSEVELATGRNHVGGQFDVELDEGLRERGIALHDQGRKKHAEEDHSHRGRKHPGAAEQLLLAAAASEAGLHDLPRGFPIISHGSTRIAPGTCAPRSGR